MARGASPNSLRRGAEGERGFSLVEVLVALAILGFIALGIAGLLTHSATQNASGFDYARLANLARVTLEDLQSRTFDDAALVATSGTPRTYASPDRRFTIDYSVNDYTVTDWTDISGVPPESWPTVGGPAANVKRVTVRVRITRRDILFGRREFVVTGLVVPG